MPTTLKFAVSGSLLVCLSAAQAADSKLQSFDIPAQPLAPALDALAKQTRLQLLYADEALKGKQAHAVKGTMSRSEALNRLVAGTGLELAESGGGAVAVKPKDTTGDGATLATVKVTGKSTYESTDPYNPDYTLRSAASATKTDTPIMETPLNIQVIPKAVLNDQQTIHMTEAMRNVSGVTTSIGSGGLSDDLYLRGFRTSTYFRNGFRIDSGFASIGTRQMANVERLEVIKGPSSVMYGRMEPGGMVNVVTKMPLPTAYYSLQQQFGSFGLFRTAADATGPISADDTLLYRFNASFESSGSFRELVDKQRIFLAPIITWNLSPQTQASLEMEYRHDDLNYDNMTWPYIKGQFIDMPRSRNLMARAPSKVDETFIGFHWSHQFNEDWSIKQRFATDLLDTDQVWTGAPSSELSPGDLLARTYTRVPGHNDTYYTTLDLTGHFDTWFLKHTVLMGADFYRTDAISHPYIADLPPINIYHPVHDDRLISPLVTAWAPSNNSADYIGAYLQDQIKLPYGFNLMGGFRYQYVKQWNNLTKQDLVTDDAVTPRVGALWQARDWLSLYGNYVENFGNSNFGALTRTSTPLPPESAQQWELGMKFEFFEGRLSATLAYFDITKQHVSTRDPADPTGAFSVAVGEVRSRGPEVDIRGEILPGWDLIATYANLDTRVTKDNRGLQGNRLFAIPRNMGSLWSTYTFHGGTLDGMKLGAGLTSKDGTTDGTGNGYETAGFTTVDLLAAYGWQVGKSRITAQLNVYNLLDKAYFTDAFLFGAGSSRTIGTPRSFLGSVRVEF